MTNRLLVAGAFAALLAAPFAAQAQNPGGAAAGAAAGATTGAIVGGPVGAVVGGVAGAAAGGVLGAPQATQVQQYVVRQKTPSVRVQERVVVGETLPQQVELYSIPQDVGVQTTYRYSVINDRTVLVDPQTRRVIQVIE
jgi:uncharacterized protein YcfJ